MLINLSNHASATWGDAQRSAAREAFGEVMDMPFPAVPPEWGTEEVVALAREYAGTCRAMLAEHDGAVHIMGELTFTTAFVAIATGLGMRCVASTSERLVTDLPGGDRRVAFRFVRFRDYINPCADE